MVELPGTAAWAGAQQDVGCSWIPSTAPSRGAALPDGKNSVWIFWDPQRRAGSFSQIIHGERSLLSRSGSQGSRSRSELPPCSSQGFHCQLLSETIPEEAPQGKLQEKCLPLPELELFIPNYCWDALSHRFLPGWGKGTSLSWFWVTFPFPSFLPLHSVLNPAFPCWSSSQNS